MHLSNYMHVFSDFSGRYHRVYPFCAADCRVPGTQCLASCLHSVRDLPGVCERDMLVMKELFDLQTTPAATLCGYTMWRSQVQCQEECT